MRVRAGETDRRATPPRVGEVQSAARRPQVSEEENAADGGAGDYHQEDLTPSSPTWWTHDPGDGEEIGQRPGPPGRRRVARSAAHSSGLTAAVVTRIGQGFTPRVAGGVIASNRPRVGRRWNWFVAVPQIGRPGTVGTATSPTAPPGGGSGSPANIGRQRPHWRARGSGASLCIGPTTLIRRRDSHVDLVESGRLLGAGALSTRRSCGCAVDHGRMATRVRRRRSPWLIPSRWSSGPTSRSSISPMVR